MQNITPSPYVHKKHPGRPTKDMEGGRSRIQKDIMEQLSYNGDLSDEQLQLLKDTLQQTLLKYNVEKEEKSEDLVMDDNNRIMEEFLETKRVENKSYNTIYNYGNEISKLFLVVNKPLQEITTHDIRKYMDYRKQHDQLKAVSINNIRMYLMSFFKWCHIEDYIDKNPMDRIGVVKTEKKVIETLSDEECEMIRCACDNERDLAIVDLLSSSGMRVSELIGLNRQDIDFEKGEVIVFGKGSKTREVPISPEVARLLKHYIGGLKNTSKTEPLFISERGNRITTAGIKHITAQTVKSAKKANSELFEYDSYTPHSFRHTKAIHMLEAGVPLIYIRNFLGHESVQTTEIYAKVTQANMNRLLSEKKIDVSIPTEVKPEKNNTLPDFLK